MTMFSAGLAKNAGGETVRRVPLIEKLNMWLQIPYQGFNQIRELPYWQCSEHTEERTIGDVGKQGRRA